MKRPILFNGVLMSNGETVKGDLINWNGSTFILPREKPCGDELFSELIYEYEVRKDSIEYNYTDKSILKT